MNALFQSNPATSGTVYKASGVMVYDLWYMPPSFFQVRSSAWTKRGGGGGGGGFCSIVQTASLVVADGGRNERQMEKSLPTCLSLSRLFLGESCSPRVNEEHQENLHIHQVQI